jgi:hypothetical protein
VQAVSPKDKFRLTASVINKEPVKTMKVKPKLGDKA